MRRHPKSEDGIPADAISLKAKRQPEAAQVRSDSRYNRDGRPPPRIAL